MAIASVATAWCSYQSSCWSSRSSGLQGEATELDRQATAQHLEAGQVLGTHARMFMEAIDAQMEGDEKRARFYTDRFREELKPAYEKWLALSPLTNPEAHPHPFTPELYTPRFTREIQDANTRGTRAKTQAAEAGHLADRYLSSTVLLAMVLLFASTAEKFEQRRVRWASLGFGLALFLFALVRTLTLPIAPTA